MKSYRHFHKNLNHYFKTDLGKLEFFVWLHTLGRSLISVFIPIFLYLSGFSIQNILIYYIIYMSLDVIFNFIARESILRIGSKITVSIGLISEIIFFVILLFPQNNLHYLFIIALFAAIYDAFYCVSQWFIFNECIYRKKNVGKNLGLLAIVQQSGTLFAPIIGGILLILLNKNYLIFIVILIFILSLYPFSKIDLKKLKPKRSEGIIDYMKNTKNRNGFFMTSLMSVHYQMENIILPLFIFITYASIEKVSFFPTLISIGTIIFTFYIAKITDKKNPMNLIMLGTLICSILWILRLIITNYYILIGTALLLSLFMGLICFPVDSRIVRNSNSKNLLDTSMYRNIAYMWPHIITYTILYFAVDIFKLVFILPIFALIILLVFALMIFLKNKSGYKSQNLSFR